MVPQEKVRSTLLNRRELLVSSINLSPSNTNLKELLEQVDAALGRVSAGTYGICEICKQPIEDDRVHADPLVRSCTSHLAPEEMGRVVSDKRLASIHMGQIKAEKVRALLKETSAGVDPGLLYLERLRVTLGVPSPPKAGTPRRPGSFRLGVPSPPKAGTPRRPRSFRRRLLESLKAAWKVFRKDEPEENNSTDDKKEDMEDSGRAQHLQSSLLPKRGFSVSEWETYYDYSPAGAVGGDYCDLVAVDGKLYFLLGDAVGKGIAGSMIASQLHSLFRALLPLNLPLNQLLERINRIFCESGVADYYATLVCGRGARDGAIELVNAGHLPPLVLRSGQATPLLATGLPLGLFYTSKYDVTELKLVPGETLLFYTDGITEARNTMDVEYGPERLMSLAIQRCDRCPEELVRACVDDVTAFSDGLPLSDDRTVMALRHAPASTVN